ncbi:glycoside hydrolase family 130 protein [Longitalea luteola]|uniref:glycoside hydrolase family 130 protein n=1 Tax=Longitalea luteola TaxID=2812563 RepID=UPI001A972466|nr:glycoside hydrolase family 130 protein [Longitalea luteola]
MSTLPVKNTIASCLHALLFIYLLACQQPAAKNTHVVANASPADSSWMMLPFVKIDSVNPVLEPGTGTFICPVRKQPVRWEEKDVFNPAAIVKDGKVFLLYRAEDLIGKHAGTSRIGLAESTDGLHFTRFARPVLFPAPDEQKKYEWEGGCEDPRVVQDSSGTYIMTYTAYDGKTARLMVASSKDLKQWTKHGPAFAKAFNGKYLNIWSKSGAIVSKYENGNIIACKINGKYWMYWGDVNIWAATSDDLINWAPVLSAPGEKPAITLRHYAKDIPEIKTVFGPRPKKFDSDLVEPGPPAMLTDKGILLLYNSRNIPAIGDSSLPEGTYTASQILMNKNDPTQVLQRMDNWFIQPEKSYEVTGQVNRVCFIEGLVFFKNKWLLYYGTADSKIAVCRLAN